jgi:hypothetical protein
MKQIKFRSLVLMAATVAIVSSCGTSRPYYSYSQPVPRSRPYVSLIISPTPGFTMNRYPDGRYCHRSPQGLLYVQGYDNRFFLDKSYINRVNYNNREYNEWKRYNDNDRDDYHRKHR